MRVRVRVRVHLQQEELRREAVVLPRLQVHRRLEEDAHLVRLGVRVRVRVRVRARVSTLARRSTSKDARAAARRLAIVSRMPGCT